jgi:hypothetical protein
MLVLYAVAADDGPSHGKPVNGGANNSVSMPPAVTALFSSVQPQNAVPSGMTTPHSQTSSDAVTGVPKSGLTMLLPSALSPVPAGKNPSPIDAAASSQVTPSIGTASHHGRLSSGNLAFDSASYATSTQAVTANSEELVDDISDRLMPAIEQRLESLVVESVVPKLTHALKDSLHHAFKSAFLDNVVPATERSLQSLFHQVGEKFEVGVGKLVAQDAAARADARALLSEMKTATNALRDATGQLATVLATAQGLSEAQASQSAATRELLVSIAESVRVASGAAGEASTAAAEAAQVLTNCQAFVAGLRARRFGSDSSDDDGDTVPEATVLVPPHFESPDRPEDFAVPRTEGVDYVPAHTAADVEADIAELEGGSDVATTLQDPGSSVVHFISTEEASIAPAVKGLFESFRTTPAIAPAPAVAPAPYPSNLTRFPTVSPPPGREGLSALASQARIGEFEGVMRCALQLCWFWRRLCWCK